MAGQQRGVEVGVCGAPLAVRLRRRAEPPPPPGARSTVGSILISLVDFSLHVAVAIFMQVHHFGVRVRVRVGVRVRANPNPYPNL